MEQIFVCPVDCLPGVGEVFGGQYSLPQGVTISGTPKVLDLGANVGAFSIWARLNWPGCWVTAYEPQPDIFKFLQRNLQGMPNVRAINSAVGDVFETIMLAGENSRLCSSQYNLGEQQQTEIAISVVAPSTLEYADIVKIDTEGAEACIIEQLAFLPRVLLLEWHGNNLRRRVEMALEGRMRLVASRSVAIERGIYVYVQED